MIRVFVSSVQKELEIERVSIAGSVSADPVLSAECEVVLYEKEPLSGRRISKPYLKCLDSCDVYLLVMDREYGRVVDALSATHEEYRHAMKRGMPIMVLVRGQHDSKREKDAQSFFEEVKADGHTYKRFHDRIDLLPEVRRGLVRILRESFGCEIKTDAVARAESAAEKASPFEQQVLDIRDSNLMLDVASQWLRAIGEIPEREKPSRSALLNSIREKGLVRKGDTGTTYKAMASGLLFLGKDPAATFPQCRVLADAYAGAEPDPRPRDQVTLSGPAPTLVEQIFEFVMRNTRHPIRVSGIQRVTLDEYPPEVIREAVVNAIAHRDYEDAARPVYVKLFYDRLEILSPGNLLRPLTITKLTKGNYEPCSRNPTLAQYLGHLHLMEQRGSGIRRMQDAMARHGLESPEYAFRDGYFVVRLKGPADNVDRLVVPETSGAAAQAIEKSLTDRQRDILERLAKGGAITSAKCMELYGITRQAINADFTKLIDYDLIQRVGSGRSTRYVLKTGH